MQPACIFPTSKLFSAMLPHPSTRDVKGSPGSGCWQALETWDAPQRCGAFVSQHQPPQNAAAQQQSRRSGKLAVHLQQRKICTSRCCTTCACIDLLARAGGLCQKLRTACAVAHADQCNMELHITEQHEMEYPA